MQPPQSTYSPLETAILTALKQGGLNRGELSDLTQQPYSRLVPLLDGLVSKKAIESYFHNDGRHLPVLTYRLRSLNLPQRAAPPPPPPPLNPALRQSRS
ncbi:hypothetical protein [Oscillatoria sp. FACHB-1407]|uniref:hypothetical protein n=1 Tax=Oscillatoria sp. FACHB-1407 TaxID=2692847 RepID=UPI0016834311|nr:hypothetical protein [Oscillatoria sp. FACHB-1407]